jgi:hypothetical protein
MGAPALRAGAPSQRRPAPFGRWPPPKKKVYNGKWYKLNNRDGITTDMYPLVIIARDANVPAGTYTYDVRGRRNGGSYQVVISGDCAPEVNCGELKLPLSEAVTGFLQLSE